VRVEVKVAPDRVLRDLFLDLWLMESVGERLAPATTLAGVLVGFERLGLLSPDRAERLNVIALRMAVRPRDGMWTPG
jgi:hypothetical protein